MNEEIKQLKQWIKSAKSELELFMCHPREGCDDMTHTFCQKRIRLVAEANEILKDDVQ